MNSVSLSSFGCSMHSPNQRAVLERGHLRHLGGMVEEVAMRGDGAGQGPLASVAQRVAESERSVFLRLDPAQNWAAVPCKGPVHLRNARGRRIRSGFDL